MVIAALTLIERKFLALNQRRVGPYYVGYRGRLQYIADALKLFIKGVVVYDESNKFWFIAVPSFAGLICYFFWVNSVWCPSVSIVDIEYNLVYASLLSVSFGFCIILLGYFSGNKYTRLASIRAALSMLNLELFLGLMILTCVTVTESFCFSVFVLYQENYWLIFTFFGLSGIICIIFLLEVGRTPFDLAEAESELVVGYSTEIGGFTFGIFYLGEYFHLFFFSAVISILFFGGWEFPNFIFNYLNIDEFFSNLHFILINYLINFDLEDLFDLFVDYVEYASTVLIDKFIDEFIDEINNNFLLTIIFDIYFFFEDLVFDVSDQIEVIFIFLVCYLDNGLDIVLDFIIDEIYLRFCKFFFETLDIEEYIDRFIESLCDLPYVGEALRFFIEFMDELTDPFDFFYYAAELFHYILVCSICNVFEVLQTLYIIGVLFEHAEDFFFYISYNVGYYTDMILDIIYFNFILEQIEFVIDEFIEDLNLEITFWVNILEDFFISVRDDLNEFVTNVSDEISNLLIFIYSMFCDISFTEFTLEEYIELFWYQFVEIIDNLDEDFIEFLEFTDEFIYFTMMTCEDFINFIFFDCILNWFYAFIEFLLLVINSDILYELYDDVETVFNEFFNVLSDDFWDLIDLVDYSIEAIWDTFFYLADEIDDLLDCTIETIWDTFSYLVNDFFN